MIENTIYIKKNTLLLEFQIHVYEIRDIRLENTCNFAY